ncbi:hypothetical protein [Marinobacterium stanieri]|uniref:hypothetical protein n=1 Tax=Marinobacterium stanieri TaxID=49186 RepID=UPI003A908249
MANTKVIITRAVQYKDTKGNTVELLPSDEPQPIPADLAKEGLDRGWAEKPARETKKAAAASSSDSNDTGDTGDGAVAVTAQDDGQTPAT